MNFWDIVNPWAALRRERREHMVVVDNLIASSRMDRDALRMSQQRFDAHDAQLRDAKNSLLAARIRNETLAKQLANAHFRNPKTGRLGRKGETFE